MKYWKRLAAMFLAAALFVGLAQPAFAMEGDETPATVEQAELGQGMTLLESSDDAYIYFDQDNLKWTFGNSQVEKAVQFTGGTDTTKKFTATSFVNKLVNKEYISSGAAADEFVVRWEEENEHLQGGQNYWQYGNHTVEKGTQGELRLAIVMECKKSEHTLQVTRHYQILPDTGVIEEWTDFTNTGSQAHRLSELRILRTRLMGAYADNVDFYHMNGDKVSNENRHRMKDAIAGTSYGSSSLTTYSGDGGDVYQPFGALHNRVDGDGVFFTWDYTGKWDAKVGSNAGKFFIQVATPGKSFIECAAGGTLSTPVARLGVFVGDLDDMGNQICDYQYKYRWQYTNDAYMNLIRFGGYGYSSSVLMNKIEANRYIGGDMLWIDDGWQKAIGDWEWNGDRPLPEMREYLEKNGQILGLWLVPWGMNTNSQIYEEHRDWSVYDSIDNASTDPNRIKKYGMKVELPEVTEYIKNMLNQKQTELGTFMLKPDFNQDKQNYPRAMAVMDILASFKQSNPQTGMHLCSDGGGLLNPGSVAYSELLLLQDGTPGLHDGYWVSMLYPMDKILTANGRGNIGAYAKTNHALFSSAMTVATSSQDGSATQEQLEPIRQDCDLYRYLRTQEVMGRYVKVYRPATSDSSGTYYFIQKMSKDAGKGYITVRFAANLAGKELTIYPKGLTAEQSYTVSTLEGGMAEPATKTGAEWMEQGIALSELKLGEVIFLNLESRPGTGTDTTPPATPEGVTTTPAKYMNVDGMEVTWTAGRDDNWISYYEIEKNGEAYDKVSAGTFYFDRNGTTEDVYRVRTVDGDGNVSEYVPLKTEPGADKAALQALYEANRDKTQGNYTAESWQAFRDAQTAAETVLNNETATQEEVNSAFAALQAAVDGLAEGGAPIDPPVQTDKTALQVLYEANKDKVQGNYTAESWQVFTDALVVAKATLDDGNAVQEDIDRVAVALRMAVEGLAEKETPPYVPPTPGGYVPSWPTVPSVPVSTDSAQGSAQVTQTTAVPSASVRNGKAASRVDVATGGEIVRQAVANHSEAVIIAPRISGNVTQTEVSIPASTVEQLGRQTEASLAVSTPVACVTISNRGLGDLSGAGGTVTIATKLTGNMAELSITAGGGAVRHIPGGVTLTVPMTDTSPGTVAMLLYEDGTQEVVRKSVAQEDSVVIPVDGSAKLLIVDNSKPFDDVPAESWMEGAAAFVSAHELFNGMAPGKFSPNIAMTRGMLAVVLHNLERNPAQVVTSVFTDVDSGVWYAEGVSWAAEQGIVNGYSHGGFGPNNSITREELAVMLWRYAGKPETSKETMNFSDAYMISSWAGDALRWAVGNGILKGKGAGILDPGGYATRAEAAQMLMNFISGSAANKQ